MDAGDIEDLIDELEDLSDSGPEMDTLSVTSTPKPSLRPFFASSRSLLAPDLSSNPSAFTFPTTGTFFNDKATALATLTTSSAGGRRLERHYSDESSKRADSDSTHAESMFTDQDRESDTPTASSAHCPSHFSTAAHDDKTKVNQYFLFFLLCNSFLFPSQMFKYWREMYEKNKTSVMVASLERKGSEKKSTFQPGAVGSFAVVRLVRERRSVALLRDLHQRAPAATDAPTERIVQQQQKEFRCPGQQRLLFNVVNIVIQRQIE
jgi:hypothetical protein